MYNGIGLTTPRGSGTNGYVQRNIACIRHRREKVDYKTDADLQRLDKALHKQPNKEILDHEWKRGIELKCLQLREELEEEGYSDGEIEQQVVQLRNTLMQEGYKSRPLDPSSAYETHKIAEASEQKDRQLKSAFGIREDYQEGSAFDPVQRALLAAQAREEREKLQTERKRKRKRKESNPSSDSEKEESSESSSSEEEEVVEKKRKRRSSPPPKRKQKRRSSPKHHRHHHKRSPVRKHKSASSHKSSSHHHSSSHSDRKRHHHHSSSKRQSHRGRSPSPASSSSLD